MRDELETMIEEILRPLLQADGGDVELVSVEDSKVVIRTKGEAAFGAGSHYVRVSVIEPAIRRVVGGEVDIHIDKSVPTAIRRSDPGHAPKP